MASSMAATATLSPPVVVAVKADPLKVMIAGAPASGKGTQCELIKSKYGLVHISAGDLLRAEIAAGSENGKRAKEFMEKGQLVPDEIVVNMVKERLLQPDAQEKGWLLDGYPRSYSQAMALETLNIRPDIFILLDVPDELLVERVVGRRLDPVKLRLQTHYQNVESLLSIYEDVIVEVKGDALVDDVFAEIDKQLTSSLDKKTEMVASA
uniref:adenylate kinase n=1 Tax=Oryza meridionalis TaxID=40149 RepID=A0A0E0EGZ6_9ORYZ